MHMKQIRAIIVRFAEFYHFAHREFIYDAVTLNQDAVKLLTDSEHWKDKPEMHMPIAVLNNGDCFVAALAIGEALRAKGHDVKYHGNGGHYFLSIRCIVGETVEDSKIVRLYLDTIYPEGKLDISEMLRHPNPTYYRPEEGDVHWLVERALEDSLDVEFVEQFVRFYDPDYQFTYAIPPGVNKSKWFYRPSKEYNDALIQR